MRTGDSKEAIFWAKKGYAYEILGKGGQIHDSEHLIAHAYELDGQIEMALLWYGVSVKTSAPDATWYGTSLDSSSSILVGRLLFKQGNKKEAFEAYCSYGTWCLEKYAQNLASKAGNDRNLALGYIRIAITMEKDYLTMRLAPFLDYKDFLTFMEEEYEKLGCPREYEEVMELFRAIDSEN